MPRYLIIAQSDVTANALGAWLEVAGEKIQKGDTNSDDLSRIVWSHPVGLRAMVDAYETLVRRIEVAAKAGEDRIPLNQVTALVDYIQPMNLNVIDESGSWESLIAMLILTFPEIRWVFGICAGAEGQEQWQKQQQKQWQEEIEPNHNLRALLNIEYRRDPLFDPTGLREWVRGRTCEGFSGMSDNLRLASRKTIAAAIDEEHPYAYLHGYTAYRFGYRVDIIVTWALMEKQFASLSGSHGYSLLLEDMSLMFPDRPNKLHLHNLKNDRAKACPQLDSNNREVEGSDYRILVTTGQTRSGDKELWDNRTYLREKAVGRGDVIFKPACGMFDLWTKAKLFRKWAGTQRCGDAPGFVSLPRFSSSPLQGSGHGTPGKLILVSEALIKRSEAMLGKVECVGNAVQGAVLATDALELTGGRTPTTAIEALSLKHRFEILAECQFSGVEYNVSITPRLEEIDIDTRAICRNFASQQRNVAVLNARMHICNHLISILRQYNQFDEEQTCMNRARHLYFTLWMRTRFWRYLFWLPIRYVELLLSSFQTFLLVVLVWIIVLGLLFIWVDPTLTPLSIDTLTQGFESAITSFFSVGTPIHHGNQTVSWSQSEVAVISFSIISGFFHLGFLVSHLYMIVSRR